MSKVSEILCVQRFRPTVNQSSRICKRQLSFKVEQTRRPVTNLTFGAIIGESAIPRLGALQIEEIDSGYKISGRVRDDREKLEVLRSLGRIRRGQVQKAKFITNTGMLVNDTFEILESRFHEEAMPDSRLLEFTILLKQK
jgi:hypothetical protein